MTKPVKHERSTRNVFADISLPNTEEHLVKAKLVLKIDRLIRERSLKQVEAAQLLRAKQPDVLEMLRGDFRHFSVKRLVLNLVCWPGLPAHRPANVAHAKHFCS